MLTGLACLVHPGTLDTAAVLQCGLDEIALFGQYRVVLAAQIWPIWHIRLHTRRPSLLRNRKRQVAELLDILKSSKNGHFSQF